MGTITELNASTSSAAPMLSAQSLLSLLHLSSPALPVGAFAYSQGLEFALDQGWCRSRDDVQQWIEDNLRYGLGCLDLPVYIRLYNAWRQRDDSALGFWNQSLLAFRETRELYLEDVQVGSAYAQWHLGQDSNRHSLIEKCEPHTVVAMSALAAVIHDIPVSQALLGFCWSWCENQIACASKSMPMGQTDGQTILRQLIPLMSEVCLQAQILEDDDIGTSLFGTAIASSLHEHQYSRLFRS